MDYARFSAKQIRLHCENNARSCAMHPLLHHTRCREADAKAALKLAEADREVQDFWAWRRAFLEPRQNAWGHLNQACEHAELAAAHAVHRVRALWAALSPMLSEEEREAWLQRSR